MVRHRALVQENRPCELSDGQSGDASVSLEHRTKLLIGARDTFVRPRVRLGVVAPNCSLALKHDAHFNGRGAEPPNDPAGLFKLLTVNRSRTEHLPVIGAVDAKAI